MSLVTRGPDSAVTQCIVQLYHCTALECNACNCNILQFFPVQCIEVQYGVYLRCTVLHYITLHSTIGI